MFVQLLQVYVVSSYFNILRTVMSDLYPLAISSTAEALMSIKRLQVSRYLKCFASLSANKTYSWEVECCELSSPKISVILNYFKISF